jgi:macrodomain Ter protein organizer (MatP/YcbG family)
VLNSRQTPSRTAKVSVTIDDAVLREVRKIARRRGATLSAQVSETLAEDLRRRKLAKLIAEYEAEHGEITEIELARVRASMRNR